MKEETIISIQDVWKSFGERKILSGLNLEIPKGKIVTMLGFSGTGKSVLLRHILGLMRPDKGHVLVKGHDVVKLQGEDLREVRQSFGMLFQEVALFDSLNVYDNVAFPLREHQGYLTEEMIERKVEDLLTLVELSRNEFYKMPDELSGGMKKRVGLARALALDPEILLCDEPTTGLDPVTTYKIDDLIVETSKRFKSTVFMISHDIHAALRISDYLAFLWQGKIIEYGTPKDLINSRHEIVQQFLSSAGVNRKSFEGARQ
jgi:phospholipid/cholesterol/gamma-HCH transport system ATP-binding protein